jgi:hypothetical protein
VFPGTDRDRTDVSRELPGARRGETGTAFTWGRGGRGSRAGGAAAAAAAGRTRNPRGRGKKGFLARTGRGTWPLLACVVVLALDVGRVTAFGVLNFLFCFVKSEP